ncbi:MAG: phosphatase PAP2 family protein [Candidatus Thermoplasmatota archaeon]
MVGLDFASLIRFVEGDLVYQVSFFWNTLPLYLSNFVYIIVYTFILWFIPLYLLFKKEKTPIKMFSYGFLLIYTIALPFYLFFPVTNVYRFYGLQSPLEQTIPMIENFFYFTTTSNNCLPSLHTSMSILTTWVASLCQNKKIYYFTFFSMIGVVISVFYLAIHWITDVITGGLTAAAVILLLRFFIQENRKK